MRHLSLYIDGQRADLDADGLILMTWTRDEASNPAAIVNSSSQSVTLPATAANDRIFGHYSRPDRVTAGDAFDPLVRTPYEIRTADTSEVVGHGYLKLDSIQRAGGGVASYSVTLYGGLGGFFYSLGYNSDGSTRTLGDLLYTAVAGVNPRTVAMPLTAATVKAAWDTLGPDAPANKGWYKLLNFAPALNGIPTDNFDASHAIYTSSSAGSQDYYANLSFTYTGDTPPPDNTVLVEFSSPHTEWEVQDLRAYLQRPVVSVRAILEALTMWENTGGYTFECDLLSLGRPFPWVDESWLTLPLLDRSTVAAAECTLYDILATSPSVSDILIGLAKVLGCVFVMDEAERRVRMMLRNTYYAEQSDDVIDLDGRVCSEVEMSPNLMNKRFYVWQPASVPGAFAKAYDETRGARYGSQRVNTGYDFNSESADVLEGVVFRGAADVLDGSINYRYGAALINNVYVPSYKLPLTETVRYTVYKSGGDFEWVEMAKPLTSSWYVTGRGRQGSLFLELPQFCDSSRKAEDGADVLLFFDTLKDIPGPFSAAPMFHLSDDSDVMTERNGAPCWDISRRTSARVINVTQLPSFRRWKVSDTDFPGFTPVWDYGIPMVVGFKEPPADPKGVYDLFWAAYISDRFDRDTKVARMKINLLGLKVDGSLLRRFFRWRGCLWALNKIENYSLSTLDPCDCELVQVKDPAAYTDL